MKHIHLAFRMNGFNKDSEERWDSPDDLRDPSVLPLRPFYQGRGPHDHPHCNQDQSSAVRVYLSTLERAVCSLCEDVHQL